LNIKCKIMMRIERLYDNLEKLIEVRYQWYMLEYFVFQCNILRVDHSECSRETKKLTFWFYFMTIIFVIQWEISKPDQ